MAHAGKQLVGIGCLVGLVGLAGACATRQMARAEVDLEAVADPVCLAAALKEQPDVVGFRRLPERGSDAWWFQLSDPALTYEAMPTFLVEQRAADESGTTLVIASTFAARGEDAVAWRRAAVAREQQILAAVIEQCLGTTVEFSEPGRCGSGGTANLCVEGRPVGRGA